MKNICDPYVICNIKKGVSDGASDLSKPGVEFYYENAFKKMGAIFVHKCPHLSIHENKQMPPKLEAFALKILKVPLYARRDSNPQPLAPEANDVLFTSLCCYNT